MNYNEQLQPMEHPDATPIPEGANLQRHNEYLRIVNADGHPLAGHKGTIPYHRFVCFESMGRPKASACVHCGYVLPWKSSMVPPQYFVVNVDHLDCDKSNNDPVNLAPSCWWCNANRSWAESAPDFWEKWRKWMADVPPFHRPNLVLIAPDFGIQTRFTDNGQTTDKSTDMSANGHTDKRPYSYTAASVRLSTGKRRTTDIHENGLVELADAILESPCHVMTRQEFVAAIETTCDISKKAAVRRMTSMIMRGIVLKSFDGCIVRNKAAA